MGKAGWASGCCFLVWTMGCADPGPPTAIYGLLDYACLNDTDIVCDGAEPGPQPAQHADHYTLAVGSRFDVHEHVNDNSTDVLRADGIVLEAVAPGIGVVVGDSGAYAHFEVRDVASFSVASGDGASFDDEVGDPLVLNDTLMLRVTALDSDGGALAGSFDLEWVSGDESVVEVRGRKSSIVELSANQPGTTTLTLRVGTETQELNLDVATN